jgi:hypothetical protein
MSAVNRVVVVVNVKLDQFGVPTYIYRNKSGGKADTVSLHTGDQIAWVVTVLDSNNKPSTPAYQLTFSDPSVFGTSSLSVPGGGFSSFLQVVTMAITSPSGQMKYSLSVVGVSPISDPLIQIDDELIRPPDQLAADHYQICWQPVLEAMTVSRDSSSFVPFVSPLIVKPGDDVTFLVDPAEVFNVDFPISPDHNPPFTPFTSGTNDLPGTTSDGSTESTATFIVRTVNPPEDPTFVFNVIPQTSTPSGPYYSIEVG